MGNWDYEDIQDQLNHPKESKETDEEEINDVDLSDIEDDADVDDDEEEIEDAEKETEEKVEDKTEKIVAEDKSDETGLTSADKQVIRDQIISRVGEDTILKIRGVKKRAGDLSPEEFVVALQKGIDADTLYQRLAADRKQIEMDRALVEKGASAVQRILDDHSVPKKVMDRGVPEILRPNADDTPEVKAWKEAQLETLEKVNAMEQYLTTVDATSKQKTVVDNVLRLRESYPMASVDEVLAVLDVRPEINSDDLMRASHEYYTSAKFLDSAIASSPTFKREYEQKVIRNYINSKKNAKTLPGKRQAATRVERLSRSSEKPSGLFDFDKAQSLSEDYIKEFDRMSREG